MSPADARTLVLAAEIERDLAQIERHAERTLQFSPDAGAPEAAFVALGLDHAERPHPRSDGAEVASVAREFGLVLSTPVSWFLTRSSPSRFRPRVNAEPKHHFLSQGAQPSVARVTPEALRPNHADVQLRRGHGTLLGEQ